MLILATWNVNKPVSARRQDEMLKYISVINADVWGFTETHDSFTDLLKKELSFEHTVSSTQGRDGNFSDAHRWVTICSKHELDFEATTDQKRTVAARVKPEGKNPFVVFGTVLPWHGDTWNCNESAGGQAFKAAVELQAGDWKCLCEKYPEDEFIVAGDFNQDLVASPPRYYGSQANRAELVAALESAGMKALTGGAFDPVRCKSKSFACIDHICCRGDSRWKLKRTLRWPDEDQPTKWLSDHYGIAVELADTDDYPAWYESARGMLRGMDTTIESEPDREL